MKSLFIEYCGFNSDDVNIIIPNTIKRIPWRAFADCEAIKSVEIPDSVVSVDESAFLACKSLTHMSLPCSVTFIGAYAFSYCESLELLKIANGSCKIEKHAFRGCRKIRRILIEEPVLELIKKSTTWWKERFEEELLPIIALDNFDKNALITKYVIKNRFQTISSLISMNRVDLIVKLLTYVTRLKIDDVDAMIKLSHEKACMEAKAILLDYKNNNFSKADIEENEMEKLEKRIGLKELTVADYKELFLFNNYMKGMGINKYNGQETFVKIPSKIGKNEILMIGEKAFKSSNVQLLILPNTIKVIEDEAFCCCEFLEKIEIPNSVIKISYGAFSNCTSLNEVILGKGITYIKEKVFSGCTSLENIVISDSVKTIGSRAFQNCYSLKLQVPKTVVKIAKNAFEGCNVDNIIINHNVEWF